MHPSGDPMVACPTCGKDLTFIPQYDRYYCYAEGKYAPRGFGGAPEAPAIQLAGPSEDTHEGHHHCSSCGKELTFISQYERWYCYAEEKYAPKDIQPVTAAPAESPAAEALREVPVETAPVAVTEDLSPISEPTVVEPQRADEPAAEPPEAATSETPASEPSPQGPMAVGPERKVPPAQEPVVPRSEELRVEPVLESAPKAETPIAEAPAPAPALPVGVRPKLRRFSILKAKKAKLAEWCEAYGLGTDGNRTVLKDRLLKYIDEHRDEEEAEAAAGATVPPAEAGPPVVEPGPETVSEPEPVATPSPEPAREPEELPPAVPEWAEPTPETPATPDPAAVVPKEVAPAKETPAVTEPPATRETPATAEPAAAKPVTPAPASVPPPVVVEVAKALPCPNCGKDLTYIAQYDRLYCFSCGRYAPKTYGKEAGAVQAPIAVEAPKAPPVAVALPKVEPPKVVPKAAHPCPTCGEELRFIKEYDRWYCDVEQKYAPKEYGKVAKNPCPTCGKELSWIAAYGRWYCYAEAKYAPKAMAAPASMAAPTVTVVRTAVEAPAARVEVAAAVEQRIAALESAQHAHGRPWAGVGLATMGFIMMLIPNLLVFFLPAFGIWSFSGTVDAIQLFLRIMFLLDLLGFVLLFVGIVVGLAFLRRREGP